MEAIFPNEIVGPATNHFNSMFCGLTVYFTTTFQRIFPCECMFYNSNQIHFAEGDVPTKLVANGLLVPDTDAGGKELAANRLCVNF